MKLWNFCNLQELFLVFYVFVLFTSWKSHFCKIFMPFPPHYMMYYDILLWKVLVIFYFYLCWTLSAAFIEFNLSSCMRKTQVAEPVEELLSLGKLMWWGQRENTKPLSFGYMVLVTMVPGIYMLFHTALTMSHLFFMKTCVNVCELCLC